MSTQFILAAGRESVEQIILDAISPVLEAAAVHVNPLLAYSGKTVLKSAVDTLAIPVAAQIVETLSGNADGAMDLMHSVRRDEFKRHKAVVAEEEKAAMHEFIDSIFAEPEPSVDQAPQNEEAPSKQKPSPCQGPASVEREKRIADLLGMTVEELRSPDWIAKALGIKFK